MARTALSSLYIMARTKGRLRASSTKQSAATPSSSESPIGSSNSWSSPGLMAAKKQGLDAGGGGGVGVPSCANCCGLVGTARIKNLCARCYRDHLNAVDNAAEAARTRALLASLAGCCLGAAAGDLNVGTFGDAHGCGCGFGFDFKKAGRERIAGENQAVVGQAAAAGQRLAVVVGAEQRARDSARDHQVEVGDGEGAAVTRLRRRRMVRTCE